MSHQIKIQVPLSFSQLVEAMLQLTSVEKQKLVTLLLRDVVKKPGDENLLLTHFASEAALAKDWLTPEEDKAWQDL
ncbi:MAG: hypothetical protein R2830_10800 [Saprospiraceae bacterium]